MSTASEQQRILSVASLLQRAKGSPGRHVARTIQLLQDQKHNENQQIVEPQYTALANDIKPETSISTASSEERQKYREFVKRDTEQNQQSDELSHEDADSKTSSVDLLTEINNTLKHQARILNDVATSSKADSTINVDRPTKNLMLSINDKLIQLTKLQEHVQQSMIQRFTSLEERFSRAHSAQISDNQQNTQNSANQTAKLASELKEELGGIKERMTKLCKETTTASILEKLIQLENSNSRNALAPSTAAARTVSTNGVGNKDLIQSIHSTLVTYLPIDLGERLAAIEKAIRAHGCGGAPVSPPQCDEQKLFQEYQQDIMSQNSRMLGSLDSIENSMARLLQSRAVSQLASQLSEIKSQLEEIKAMGLKATSKIAGDAECSEDRTGRDKLLVEIDQLKTQKQNLMSEIRMLQSVKRSLG